MFDFGDEVTIESYIIPWLMWIQILVMLLLMLLLYGFTLLALDLPESSSSSSSSSSASLSPDSQLGKKPVFKEATRLVPPCFQASQVGQNQSIKGEIGTGTSRRRVRGEDSVEMEGCSSKPMEPPNQNCYHHPCHYLRLAKLAFLKCLGLDFLSSENTSIIEQRKQR